MVLVDAEHEDGLYIGVNGKPVAISSLSDAEFDAAWEPPSGPPPAVPQQQLQAAHLKLPAAVQQVRLALQRRMIQTMFAATPESMRATVRSEHTALVTLHRLSAEEAHPLKALPLIVLARGRNQNPRQLQMQQDLARLSSNSQMNVIGDSDHEIHLFRPDVVIKAIADVQTGTSRATVLTMNSSVEMEGVPSRPPSRIIVKISGGSIHVDVETMGQVISAESLPRAVPLEVSLAPAGRTQAILGRECEAFNFIIPGRSSGNVKMLTKGVVWVTTSALRVPANLSAPATPAFGVPGGDFEAFVSLISRIGGIPCRIDAVTALDGTSGIVELLKLQVTATSVLTSLEVPETTN